MRSSRLKRIAPLALVLAGLTALGAGSPANAATYVEQPCTSNIYTNGHYWSSPENRDWRVTAECPTGVRMALLADASSGDLEAESTVETTEGEIQSISAHLIRPDGSGTGIEASIQACRLNTCGALSTSTTDPDTALELTLASGQIPDGATRVVYRAKCILATCPAGDSVYLSGLSVTRRDDTPPFLWLYEIDDNYLPVLPADSKWHSGEIKYDYQGIDIESRLKYFHTQLGDVNRCFALQDPWLDVPDCEMVGPYEFPRVFASDVADGHHELSLTLFNRAGLSTTSSIAVKTDTTPPARPSQFQLTPRLNGWVRSRDVRIDWANTGETVETETQSGIVSYRYDVNPVLGGSNPPSSTEDPPETTVTEVNPKSLQFHFPSDGQWEVSLRTIDGAGNVSDPGTVDVSIDSAEPMEPDVGPIAPINAAATVAGRTISWDPGAAPASGICGYDWAFAAVAGYNPGEDPATPLLGGAATQLTLTPSQLLALEERPQRFHIRAYSCSGNASEIAHIPVVVDRTAPSVVISPGGNTIRGDEPVSIAVQDVLVGSLQSGIASVDCEVNAEPVACGNGTQLALRGGRQELVVTATDVAGNATTAEAHFIVDASPPNGWIEPANLADPTLVRAAVNDVDSGIRSAVLEYKHVAGGAWTRLDEGFNGASPAMGTVALSGRIPDDGELANGDYLLRVRVTDGVSTSALITRRSGGESATFHVPLRAATVMTAGLKKSSSSKSRAVTRFRVRYGTSPVLVGTLKRPDGAPVAGALLSVSAEQSGSPTRTIGFLSTGTDGSYSWRVPRGASRTLIVRFAGNLSVRTSSAESQLRVRGKLGLRLSRSSVRTGRKVRLRGKVYARGAAIPLIGKLVELKFSVPGRRSGWKRTLRTDAAGRFDYAFKYRTRRKAVRFEVRALAPAEPTWGFDAASSHRKKFVVRP